MARGDGKARKGLTKGRSLGVKRMAAGGFAASSREGGFAAAGPSRLESPGQRASVSPGAGNISAGRVPGGGGRSDPRNPQSNTARVDYLTNPTRASVRLGPNAAQAMADAGVNPDTATYAAKSINRMVGGSPSILGDPNPGQRLATANRDGSFTYSPIQSSTIVKNQRKQIYDRILPEDDMVGGFGPFNPKTGYVPKMQGASIDTGWDPVSGTFRTASTPTLPSTRMTSAQDMASVVPGSVSFTQDKTFTPFAQTKAGMDLLEQSKNPLTVEQAKALKSQFPEGSSIAIAGGKPPPGTTAYPATVGGFKVDVFVPNKAGVTTLGPKVGEFNPSFQPTSTLAGYTGQDQRFPSAPPSQTTPKTDTPKPPAGTSRPPSVVAGRNFTAGATPYGGRGGEGGGGRRRRKKPIIEETVEVKNGGFIRGDGKSHIKTRGRVV